MKSVHARVAGAITQWILGNRLVRTAGCTVGGFCAVLLAAQMCHASDERPNIIVILADDLGYSDLGFMGGEIETPALDRLANEGLVFTHMYNTARCSTTRASLLTGLYSHAAGVGHLDKDLGKPGYRGFISKDVKTLPEHLSAVGYRTILSGKWHLGRARDQWPDRRGFDRFYGIPNGGGLYFIPSRFVDRPIYRNGVKQNPSPEGYYTTEVFTDEAIAFIEESKTDGKPFFLYLAHIAPHFPLQAPAQAIDKYLGQYSAGYAAARKARFERQKALGIIDGQATLSPIAAASSVDDNADLKMATYAAQVDILDQNIGRLLASLKKQGLYENTIILFLSDNGAASAEVNREGSVGIGSVESFASYGKSWANVSNTPYREYKKLVHEGGIITPMVMHWPNGLRGISGINRAPVHVIDIVPTILDAVGFDYQADNHGLAPQLLHGKSFLGLAKGNDGPSARYLFWEHEGNRAVRLGRHKAVAKLGRPWELYDLSRDATELDNVALKYPAKLRDLINEYESWADTMQVEPWPIVH